MDPDTALELVKKGATLLLLDVPQFTLFGIDTQMFSVGPMFKGIKMIPPGPHFVYYSSSNKEGNQFSPTIGFFINPSPSEVVVRRWHGQEERLVKVSEDEETRYCEAVKHMEFDSNLGPYPLDQFGEWRLLSDHITSGVIERIQPIGEEITIVDESGMVNEAPRMIMERRMMEQLKDSKISETSAEESHKRGCYYTTIPHFVKHKNISGEELTALNLDKSKLLEIILSKDFEGKEDMLLGELQFAFITFMMGQSLQGFLQWKAFVSLLLSCTEAPLRTRNKLFSKFIRVIYCQVRHGLQKGRQKSKGMDMGNSVFLDDAWFSKDIFLYRLCKDFFPLVLHAQVVDGDLLSWTRKLKTLLETTLGWDFEGGGVDAMCEEDDEFSPVFVSPEEANMSQDPASYM